MGESGEDSADRGTDGKPEAREGHAPESGGQRKASGTPQPEDPAVKSFALWYVPVDFLILTFEALRMGLWISWRLLMRAFAIDVAYYQPCREDEWVRGRRSQIRVCKTCRKYRNPWMIHLICPGYHATRSASGVRVQGCVMPRRSGKLHVRFGLGATLIAAVWATSLFYTHRVLRWTGVNARVGRFIATYWHDSEAAAAMLVKADQLVDVGKYGAAKAQYRGALESNPGLLEAYLGLGTCEMALDLEKAAVEAYAAAVQIDPDCFPARIRLASLLQKHGIVDTALVHAQKALELSPDSPEAHRVAGECLLRKGKLDEAIGQIKQALALAPDDNETKLVAGTIALRQGNTDEAVRVYRDVLKTDPDSKEAKLGLGRALRNAGSTEEAIRVLTLLFEENLADSETLGELVGAHLQNSDPEAAVAVYRRAVEHDPMLYIERARLAQLLFRLGKQDEGYEAARKLLRDHPGDILAHLILGHFFLKAGIASEAVEHGSQAQNRASWDMNSARLLALAHMQRGDMSSAAVEFERVAKEYPDHLETIINLSRCYEQTGRHSVAVDLLNDAIERLPDAPQLWFQLALAHILRGNLGDARKCLERTLELQPDDAAAANNLAQLLLDTEGDLDRATQLAQQALMKYPDNALFLDTLAWCHYKQGKLQKAVDVLTDGGAQEPRLPDAMYHLAIVYFDMGKLEEAGKILQKYVDTFPEASQIKEARAALERVRAQLAQ